MFKFLIIIIFLCIGTNIFAFEKTNKEETLTDEPSFLSTPNKILEQSVCSEYANLDTVFERVITLGDDCATKKQINEYFSPHIHWRNTKTGHSDLFDWMIINDYNLLADALSLHLIDFFERQDFVDGKDNRWKMLINKKYNMCWNHLFDKEYEGYWVVDQLGNLLEEGIDMVFPMIKEKINHLKNKFIQAKEKNTLYVLNEKYSSVTKETLYHLRDSLVCIREGNRDFSILFVTKEKSFDDFENIFVRESVKTITTWGPWDGGDNERWRTILGELKFTSEIWN